MSESCSNPYAAPMLGSSPSALPNGNGRFSHETLQRVIWLIDVAQFTFIGSWLLMVGYWMPALFPLYFNDLFFHGSLLLALAALVSTIMLTSACRSGMSLIALTICVPYIGVIPFVGCINYARGFLVWNGYRPGIVGAQPDLVELAAMEANPNYRPSARFHKDGSKRRLPPTLTTLVGGIAILTVISIVGITLMQS